MYLTQRLYLKTYYFIVEILIKGRTLDIHGSFGKTRNLFLYFDYEREFGGHVSCITNEDIQNLLYSLDQYNLKATWFTVGKIFEQYPESIEEILRKGHEIGSHTYAHISPLNSTVFDLKKDFQHFQNASSGFIRVKGFHYPNNKWSINTLKELARYDITYDVIYCHEQSTRLIPAGFFLCNKHVLRFCSVGDDWPLYKKKITEDNAFNHFLNLYWKVKIGTICGIGFHPWVLVSDKNIMKGFLKFLKYLSMREDRVVKTAFEYAMEILDHNKSLAGNK